MSEAARTAVVRPHTIRELIPVALGWLSERGVSEARLDTESLLAHVLGCRRLDLYLDHDRALSEDERARFRELMRRRGAREPLAYLTGTRGFHSLELTVGPGVLIPRPETEHLVEVALEELARLREGIDRPLCFADVGTGSGCVALALLHECPDLQGFGLDVSAEALEIAAQNAQRHDLSERLQLKQGDLLSPLEARATDAIGPLDLIVSNPPYVTPAEGQTLLEPEVRDHEPHAALFDEEGLPLTRRLVEQAVQLLRPGGALAVETGWDKAPLVEGFFQEVGFEDVRAVRDLSGIERVVVGRRPLPA